MIPYLPLVAVPLVAVALARRLKGRDLSDLDSPHAVDFHVDPNTQGLQTINSYLAENFSSTNNGIIGGGSVEQARARFDALSKGRRFPVRFTPLSIDNNGYEITGEWVQAKGADTDRRLLYLHGGAFRVGSAVSHRAITAALAKATKASICAINYRLLPEHRRMDASRDARRAYTWLLENGPDGPAPMQALAIGGDSAGGNLALGLLNWVRDQGLSPVNAAFAISPLTDSTLNTPGFDENLDNDHMLGPILSPVAKLPPSMRALAMFKMLGMNPSAPDISPVRADLSNLPPTLIHASRQEILYYDALRYANKSKAAGNEIELQVWDNLPHVWHIFDSVLPEAEQAMDEIVKFLNRYGF